MEGELLRLGPIALYSYGTSLAASFLAGVVLARREARNRGFDSSVVVELVVQLMVICLVVGRLGYVLPDLPFYLTHPAELFKVPQGGLSYVPAFLAGVVYVFRFAELRGHDYLSLLDVLAPGLAMGLVIGSLGAVEVQPYRGAIQVGSLWWSPPMLIFFTIEYAGLWYLAASRRRMKDGCRFCQIVSADAVARITSSGWAWHLYGEALPHAISVVVGILLFGVAQWQSRKLRAMPSWHLPVRMETAVAAESAGVSRRARRRRRRLPVRRRAEVALTWFGVYVFLVILLSQTRG